MQTFPHFTVVDSRLQAGRGEEFSASRQREQEQLAHAQRSYDDAEPWHLPIGHRPQDSLDVEGLTMASTDTAIPQDNKGYRMLQKMGWKGTGLGRDENGIVEPVKGGVEAGLRLGVGKAEQESFYTAADNVVRKKLEVELQADEDQQRRGRREMNAERAQQIKQDVSTIQQTFYCQTCHKQYKNAFEMEAHMSSYDHHHKKRLIEMRTDEAERTRSSRDKKEKKRADKEMARLQAQIQAAQAAAAPTTSSSNATAAAAAPAEPPEDQPPLPPLPPEEDYLANPPPPPPPDPTPPYQSMLPRPPAAPLPAVAQPSQRGSQYSHQPQPHSAISKPPHQQHQGFLAASSSQAASASLHGNGLHQARVPIKTEPDLQTPLGSSQEPWVHQSRLPVKTESQLQPRLGARIKTEGASHQDLLSNQPQVPAQAEKQPAGAVQFGFGLQQHTANKVSGMRRPAAMNKRPSHATKPRLAAFGDVDSDDDDAA